jgi:hypothetical protein
VGDLLKLRVKAGEIRELREQQTVRLTRAQIAYKADFSYVDCETGKTVWVEAKGVQGERWRIIKRLWVEYGPGPLEVWMGRHQSPELVEVIEGLKL